jgi:type I restriction enzyme S subunit
MLKSEHFSKHYPIKPLGDVVDFLDNLRKPVKSSNRIEGEYLYYGANGVQGSIDQYIFDEPLVLLAEDGGHFGNPEKTIAYIARGKYWVNNHAHVLKPKECIDLNFLCRVLEKYDVIPFIKGATRAKLTKGDALTIPIPVPPLPEQKRIAAILDKADSLRRKNQQAIQLADKFLRAVFLDLFGDPVTNPKAWDVKQLKEGVLSIKSGWSANGESIPCNSEQLGVLKISAVTSGVFKASENKYVPSETIPKNKALIFPKKGDLLFSRANTRELVAATCIVPESNDNVFLPDKLWKVETNKEKLLPEFLHYSIQQPRFRDLLTSQATGTSGSMLNISKAKFEESDIIFPDIRSQKKFAEIYWKIQKVFSKLNQSSVYSFDGFNSLSQKAFAGEL